MGVFRDLLDGLPGHISLDPQAHPIVALTYDGTCRVYLNVDEDRLELVVSGGTGATVDLALSAYSTIADLATAIDGLTGFTATVLDATGAALAPISLVDADVTLAEDNQLYQATAALWFIVRLVATMTTELQANRLAALQQFNIFTASGGWLDLWGYLYGYVRFPTEDDDRYRRRLIWSVTLPRVNGKAMEMLLLRGLGIESTITDEAMEVFIWNDGLTGLAKWYTLGDGGSAFLVFEGWAYLGVTTNPPELWRTFGTFHQVELYHTFTGESAPITALASFGGRLYAGVDDSIYVCNAGVWTVDHVAPYAVAAMVATLGELWVLQANGTISRYDGTSWTDGSNTHLTVGHCLAVYSGDLIAGGNDGSGPLVEVWDPDLSTWSQLGTNVPSGTSVLVLCEYADGLRAGCSGNSMVMRYIAPLWGDEHDTAQSDVTALVVHNGELYAGTGSDPVVFAYNGSSWSTVDSLPVGCVAVTVLGDFAKINEVVILVDTELDRQYHYLSALLSGQEDESLWNLGPNLAPGRHLFAFLVEADIPNTIIGEVHPLNHVIAAIQQFKAAGTIFRVVDTSVGTLAYPTPAIGMELAEA